MLSCCCISYLHTHVIWIHVETATGEVVCDAIAEPQAPAEHVQEASQENSAQGPADPSEEQQPEGKSRSITYYFKL